VLAEQADHKLSAQRSSDPQSFDAVAMELRKPKRLWYTGLIMFAGTDRQNALPISQTCSGACRRCCVAVEAVPSSLRPNLFSGD
jgi:hypothetical protein